MKHFSILWILVIALDVTAETVAFIGSPTSVVKSQHSCDHYLSTKDEDVVCINSAFVLNYEVYKWLGENTPKESVEFIGFYHFNGIPNYIAFPYALIILDKHKEHLLLRNIRPLLDVDSEADYVCKSEITAKAIDCSDIQEVKQYLSLIDM